MDKWIIGVQQNQKVDYIVNYEVSQLKSTAHMIQFKSKFENALKSQTSVQQI